MADRLLYTFDEAAQQLSISVRHVYRLVDQGELTAVRIGRAARITHESLTAYVKRLTAQEGG